MTVECRMLDIGLYSDDRKMSIGGVGLYSDDTGDEESL